MDTPGGMGRKGATVLPVEVEVAVDFILVEYHYHRGGPTAPIAAQPCAKRMETGSASSRRTNGLGCNHGIAASKQPVDRQPGKHSHPSTARETGSWFAAVHQVAAIDMLDPLQ